VKERAIAFWNRYERHLSALTLVCGFTFDLFLAKRPDSIADNILLLFYLCVAALIIVVLNRRSRALWLLLVLQFCFGGLASNLLVLYGKSGSLGGSLVFIALLVGLLIGNEFLKTRYEQLRFNIAVYYVLLLTYVVIALPTFVLHSIGTRSFLISGVVSLCVIALFLWAIFVPIYRSDKKKQLVQAAAIVLGIFGVFNGMYFLNIIPPVPLSLKEAGIYHSVMSDGRGNYTGTYEQKHWYEFWRDTADTYHVSAGEPAYCFSAVFAPGKLATPIVHRWEYYYPADSSIKRTQGAWVSVSEVQFPITGGRAEGYRGYSIKRVLEDGQWRCTVATVSGQVIGRITFEVKTGSTTPPLSTTAL
jgi:hypothetical protein